MPAHWQNATFYYGIRGILQIDTTSLFKSLEVREATYHLDVQFAFRVVNGGQRLEEGKHEWLGAGPAADQEANLDPLFVRQPPQLGIDVGPVPV